MTKKYGLTDKSIRDVEGPTIYRIKALRDFSNVKAGDLGGYVEFEDNLSHNGNCWVYDDARIIGNARVYGGPQIFGSARVDGHAHVSGNARVYENASVSGNAHVAGNAQVYGNAWIHQLAQIYGNAQISGYSVVSGQVHICGNAWVSADDWTNIHVKTKIDRGVWTLRIHICGGMYLLSPTLEKLFVGKLING